MNKLGRFIKAHKDRNPHPTITLSTKFRAKIVMLHTLVKSRDN